MTRWRLVSPLFLPSPAAVWQRFLEVGNQGFGGASLWQHTWISIYRVFSAFFLSCMTAIPVGLAMGMSRIFRGIFDPPIEFYRPIPPLAYLPLVIIWFGIGEVSKIILIYLACFAPMALSTRSGVRSVSIEQIHAAYSLGATRAQVVRHVVLKASLPEILTGMRIGIGFGWTTLVAAEMVAAAAGLGYMILNASEFLVTDVVVMGIVLIGVIALLSDLLMRYLEKKLVPWKGQG
jgi:taurine transport system permease protein